MNVKHPVLQTRNVSPCERLDGWKSIAAYLKRDRTTVIRWARERGLPVHRMPGGRIGTVYALKHELDRWVGLPDSQTSTLSAPTLASASALSPLVISEPPLPLLTAQFSGHRWMFALAAVGIAVGILNLIAMRGAAVADPPHGCRTAVTADEHDDTGQIPRSA